MIRRPPRSTLLSLHDALPICRGDEAERTAGCPRAQPVRDVTTLAGVQQRAVHVHTAPDRKSTRLNSSHANISYAVFCLKKKKNAFLFVNILINIYLHFLHLSL